MPQQSQNWQRARQQTRLVLRGLARYTHTLIVGLREAYTMKRGIEGESTPLSDEGTVCEVE